MTTSDLYCRRTDDDQTVRAWQFIDSQDPIIPGWLTDSVVYSPEFHRVVVIGAHGESVDTAYTTDWLILTEDSKGNPCIRVMGSNRFELMYDPIAASGDTTTGTEDEDDLDDDVGEDEDEEEEEDETTETTQDREREQRV